MNNPVRRVERRYQAKQRIERSECFTVGSVILLLVILFYLSCLSRRLVDSVLMAQENLPQ